MWLHVQLGSNLACFDGLQSFTFSATDPSEEMQTDDELKGSQTKLVGSLLTDLEAARLDDLVHKASVEAASGKVGAACSDTFAFQHQGMTCVYVYNG